MSRANFNKQFAKSLIWYSIQKARECIVCEKENVIRLNAFICHAVSGIFRGRFSKKKNPYNSLYRFFLLSQDMSFYKHQLSPVGTTVGTGAMIWTSEKTNFEKNVPIPLMFRLKINIHDLKKNFNINICISDPLIF